MAIVIVGGMVLGAVVGLFLGAHVGGNFTPDFRFLHLRGYEATGVLGLLLGIFVGGALGARWRRRPAR